MSREGQVHAASVERGVSKSGPYSIGNGIACTESCGLLSSEVGAHPCDDPCRMSRRRRDGVEIGSIIETMRGETACMQRPPKISPDQVGGWPAPALTGTSGERASSMNGLRQERLPRPCDLGEQGGMRTSSEAHDLSPGVRPVSTSKGRPGLTDDQKRALRDAEAEGEYEWGLEASKREERRVRNLDSSKEVQEGYDLAYALAESSRGDFAAEVAEIDAVLDRLREQAAHERAARQLQEAARGWLAYKERQARQSRAGKMVRMRGSGPGEEALTCEEIEPELLKASATRTPRRRCKCFYECSEARGEDGWCVRCGPPAPACRLGHRCLCACILPCLEEDPFVNGDPLNEPESESDSDDDDEYGEETDGNPGARTPRQPSWLTAARLPCSSRCCEGGGSEGSERQAKREHQSREMGEASSDEAKVEAASPPSDSPPNHRHRWVSRDDVSCPLCASPAFAWCVLCYACFCVNCSGSADPPLHGPWRPGPTWRTADELVGLVEAVGDDIDPTRSVSPRSNLREQSAEVGTPVLLWDVRGEDAEVQAAQPIPNLEGRAQWELELSLPAAMIQVVRLLESRSAARCMQQLHYSGTRELVKKARTTMMLLFSG